MTYKRDIVPGIARVNSQFSMLRSSRLTIHPQLRSEWDPINLQCIERNSDSSKLNIIVLVIADIVLLLTVLIGLFRWRSGGGDTFGIGGLLWKQVG
jgi:hypothetical protein